MESLKEHYSTHFEPHDPLASCTISFYYLIDKMRGCTDFPNFQALKGCNFHWVSITSHSCTRSSRAAAWNNTDPGLIHHRLQLVLGTAPSSAGWELFHPGHLVPEEFCQCWAGVCFKWQEMRQSWLERYFSNKSQYRGLGRSLLVSADPGHMERVILPQHLHLWNGDN